MKEVLTEMPLKVSFTISKSNHMVYRYSGEKAISFTNEKNNEEAVDRLMQLPEKVLLRTIVRVRHMFVRILFILFAPAAMMVFRVREKTNDSPFRVENSRTAQST